MFGFIRLAYRAINSLIDEMDEDLAENGVNSRYYPLVLQQQQLSQTPFSPGMLPILSNNSWLTGIGDDLEKEGTV